MGFLAKGIAAISLHVTGGKFTAMFWPTIGIIGLLLLVFIASKFVRGDPYYDQTASRDRRDTGGAPVPFGHDGGDGGGGDGGNGWH